MFYNDFFLIVGPVFQVQIEKYICNALPEIRIRVHSAFQIHALLVIGK